MRLNARAAEALRIEEGEVVSRLKAWVRGGKAVSIMVIGDNIVARSLPLWSMEVFFLGSDARSQKVVVGSKRCSGLTCSSQGLWRLCRTANTNTNSVRDAASRVSRTNI
jgi:hypothetical protein